MGMKPTNTNDVDGRTLSSEIRWYYHHLNLLHLIFTFGPLVILIPGVYYVSLTFNTFIMMMILNVTGGMTLTIGYHRLWSHRTFRACTPLRYLLAISGAGQCQWSIMWWVRHHRAHHRYTDTEKDPYNAKRGFLHTHVGWLVFHTPEAWGDVDISDLKNDPVVVWQQRYYVPLAALVAAVIPIATAHYGWDDWKGGLVYGCVGRVFYTLHNKFLVNSVAHASWAGDQPYSNLNSARNSYLLALITWGEGNHNFHHAFPADYRNGILWYEVDMSKMVIELWARLGWVWDLHITSPGIIHGARLWQSGKQKKGEDDSLDEPALEQMEWQEYNDRVRDGQCLLLIDGFVHDVESFVLKHPGGSDLVHRAIGTDATEAFHGLFHSHSAIATTWLKSLRIAILDDSGKRERHHHY